MTPDAYRAARSPIETLPPDQIAALVRRIVVVLDAQNESDILAPFTNSQLKGLTNGHADQLLGDRDFLQQLAAWVACHTKHDGALTKAFPGPTPPFSHLHDCWFNFFEGPSNGVAFSRPADTAEPSDFLGLALNFPFGVPASALTPQHEYVSYFAERGFDLLTFKTVRERRWNPHPFPHIAFVDGRQNGLVSDSPSAPVFPTLDPGEFTELGDISLVNSFGVPSLAVERWKLHVAESVACIRSGQILIVSVMGSPDAEDTKTDGELIRQFCRAALEAEDAGANIIELNLSCPNTGGHAPIYQNPELAAQIVEAVHGSLLQHTPLLIKIGYLPQPPLEELISSCRRWIDGVVAINTVTVPSLRSSRDPFFPSRRSGSRSPGSFTPNAGMSGAGIRAFGLEMARNLVELREKPGPTAGDWVIVGVGGVMTPADYHSYRALGVDAVQSCSGAWLNHRLASDIRATVAAASPNGSGDKTVRQRAPDDRSSRARPANSPVRRSSHDIGDERGAPSWRRRFHDITDFFLTGGLSLRGSRAPEARSVRRRSSS